MNVVELMQVELIESLVALAREVVVLNQSLAHYHVQ
jgi:hypothetical protein